MPALFFFAIGADAAAPPKQTINVYTAAATLDPAKLASQFLADATNQYNATLVPGLFANSFTLTITDKKPAPPVTDPLVRLEGATKALTAISSDTYAYGWADGIDYSRGVDIGRLDRYAVDCGTASVFGASSTTWSPSACSDSLGTARKDIFDLSVSSPTPPPGF